MNISYLLSRALYKFRKSFKSDFPRKKILDNKNPRVLLLGTVEHMNYGDQAINIGEYDFFNRKGIDFIEIPESYLDETFELLSKYSSNQDVFYFHGGGNMGDVWPQQEVWRQKLLRDFPENKIIFFPQSISYKSLDSELYKTTSKLAGLAKDLTICLRDNISFEFVKRNFPENVHVVLVPDMVMTLSDSRVYQTKYDVLTLFRSDVERDNDELKNDVTQWLMDKSHLKIKVSDTVRSNWQYVDRNNRRAFVFKKLKEFKQAKVVVTDRLHGLILSYISSTPVVVFDNNNHKIRNFYTTWLKQADNIYFVDETSNVEMTIAKITAFTQEERKLQDNSEYYKDMVDKIG